ncbi:MAG: AbrB/MazE/SpoVT family DNA-binding domain-containing protein [Leptospiraceae bacterium]|nr:AbrB/MazE/SpoVT family DNA-binding domain-containing protein [Leptospiraceae bacterium]
MKGLIKIKFPLTEGDCHYILENMDAVLDKTGRVVIPHQVRENLHLEPGQELEVLVHGYDIILRVKKEETVVDEEGMLLIESEWDGDPDLDKLIEKSRSRREKDIWKNE